MKNKINIVLCIIVVILLIITIISFNAYINSSNYNNSILYVEMENAGSEALPVKLDVSFLTGKLATKAGKSYYFAGNETNIFIISTNKILPNALEKIKEYTYSITDEKPESYTINGRAYLIDEGLKELALESYNKLYPDKIIGSSEFETYFGEYYLNIEDVKDKNENLKLIVFICSIFLTFLVTFILIKNYLKNKQ